ncbi:sensor histidine kinase [Segnochrobactrum spirostomi]|uniref:sensor histidine kinase n=1 Tax=Segnochrobactrum spirostomi TaxID=2608987 RepID=UPI001FE51A70|nr:ATP-binding protein [Segnochrobactrum spirostomi]
MNLTPSDISKIASDQPQLGDGHELTRSLPDGGAQYLATRRFPILQDDAKAVPILYALTFTDETPLREAQRSSEELVEKLLRADRQAALGEMAMALAHELSQPLGAIVNFAGAARRTLLGRAIRAGDLEDVLLNIGAEAARAGEVIKSLRQFLRGAPQPSANANVEGAIKAVLGFAEPAMREQAVQIQVDVATNLPPIQGDQIILQQIILNLVTNAIQAMDDAPRDRRRLAISAVLEQAAKVRIDVRDSGIGLPTELGERIFEPFITTKEHGSGLGLSIARTLVQRLGGSIEAVPEPEIGTRFTIRVPVRQQRDHYHA